MDQIGPSVRSVRLLAAQEQIQMLLDEVGKEGTRGRQRRLIILRTLQVNPDPVDASVLYSACGANSTDLQKLQALGLIDFLEHPSPTAERRQAALRFLLTNPVRWTCPGCTPRGRAWRTCPTWRTAIWWRWAKARSG